MPRSLPLLACLLVAAPALAQSPEEVQRFREHYSQGEAAYRAKDWDAAAAAFEAAAKVVPESSAVYNAACCYALAGKSELALEALGRSIELGFHDDAHIRSDPDLASLRELPGFAAALAKIPAPDGEAHTLRLEGDEELPELRYYVSVPPEHDPQVSAPVVLAFPPGPGTAAMVQAGLDRYWRDEGARRGYLVVSVQIQGQRMHGRAKAVVEGVLAAVAADYGADLARVVVAGFSNGGLAAFHALTETKGQGLRGLVGIPGAFPGGLALEGLELEGFPVLLMVGERDESWVPFVETTKTQLEQLGAEVEAEVLPGQGHVIEVLPSRLFDWIDGVLQPGEERREF